MIQLGSGQMPIGIRRREFAGVVACAMFGWPVAANGQQPNRARKVGILMPLAENDPESQRRIAAFFQMLRQFGWVDGKTILIETRFAGGNPKLLPTLASELVLAKVDVIITQAAEPVEAVRAATTTIPIVMAAVGDALGAGYVKSLAHPGGNITGLTLVATDQSTKRLQLIKELLPAILRIALLSNANAVGHRLQIKEMEPSVAALGLSLLSLPVHTAGDIDSTLRAATDGGAQAIITMDDPLIQSLRARIVAFGLMHHLPVMGEFRPMTEAGGLMSYGPNQIDMWKHAAVFVDKILNGTSPADLPVEQPTKFELVINLKTAKALGLTVPDELIALADEVIE
jgi:putative tryptophan/tyrosine transport system substrate-binding protein